MGAAGQEDRGLDLCGELDLVGDLNKGLRLVRVDDKPELALDALYRNLAVSAQRIAGKNN